MENANVCTLSFMHSKLSFWIEESLSLETVFDFFGTHFIRTEGAQDHVLANIILTKSKDLFQGIDFAAGEDIYLRKSVSDFFTIPAKSIVQDGVQYVQCTKTETYLALNSMDQTITIATEGNDPEAEELVFIELIRDLVLKNEENHGVVVLHATCAYRDGQATLMIGPKGAGKSTTLLELVSKYNYLFMSGDKTFIWVENGKLLASGWPDYPHLGLGTLSKYTHFIEEFNLSDQIDAAQEDLWSTEHKRAISPDVFKSMIPHATPGLITAVGCFIYPQLQPSDDCQLLPCKNHASEMRPHIERIFEQGHVPWNTFITPQHLNALDQMIEQCIQNASELPAYQLKGSGVLSDVAILLNGVTTGK